MAQVEEERNQTLLNLDKLRRQVRSVQGDIERLLQENQDLADRLPKPETSRDVTQAK
jgi:regulator of replication initiation timing